MNKYGHIIECALQRKLSIEALSYEGANQAFSEIRSKAQAKGLKTVITTARHLYKMHVDFKITNSTFRLFVTIDLYKEKFKLHKYLFFPFKLPTQQITTSICKLQHEFIAIGRINGELAFIELTRQ